MERANRWQPVLHSPTRRGPASWLVRPDGLSTGALCQVAETLLADDRPGPMHLLLRSGPLTVVGGVTRAAVLTDALRPAAERCFVGWVTRQDQPGVPRLDRLEDRWVAWAGDVYEGWMPVARPDVPHEPPLGPPPWTTDDEVHRPVPVGSAARSPHAPAVPWTEVGGPARHQRWASLALRDGDLTLVASAEASAVLPAVSPPATAAYQEPYLDGDYREAGFTSRR